MNRRGAQAQSRREEPTRRGGPGVPLRGRGAAARPVVVGGCAGGGGEAEKGAAKGPNLRGGLGLRGLPSDGVEGSGAVDGEEVRLSGPKRRRQSPGRGARCWARPLRAPLTSVALRKGPRSRGDRARIPFGPPSEAMRVHDRPGGFRGLGACLRGGGGGELPGLRSDSRDGWARWLLRPARRAQEEAAPRLAKMSEDLWGTGEEEEEEEVTGALSTQTGDPPPAGRDRPWQIVGAGCRTLCHPSFQPFYSAILGCSRCSRHPTPGGPGPPPFLDCSSFFYMDPTQPPGSRIYNWLSRCSLEVLHRLPLDTPTPIMAPQETPPAPGLCTRRRWLSSEELQAVSALLQLPAGAQAAPQADRGAEQGGP